MSAVSELTIASVAPIAAQLVRELSVQKHPQVGRPLFLRTGQIEDIGTHFGEAAGATECRQVVQGPKKEKNSRFLGQRDVPRRRVIPA